MNGDKLVADSTRTEARDSVTVVPRVTAFTRLRQRAVANREKAASVTEELVKEFGAQRVTEWWTNLGLLLGFGSGMFFTALVVGEHTQATSILMLAGFTMGVVFYLGFLYTEVGREFQRIAKDAGADWRGGMGDMTDAEWDANMEYLARTAAKDQMAEDTDADWFFKNVATILPRDTKGWVVVYQRKIVAVADRLKDALEEADLPPGAEPFVVQWPLRGCVDTRH